MRRRRRNGSRSATLHFVLEDRRVDELLERAIGLERLITDLQAQVGRAEARIGPLEASVRELEAQRDRVAAAAATAEHRLDQVAGKRRKRDGAGEVKP